MMKSEVNFLKLKEMENIKKLKIPLRFRASRGHYETLKTLASMEGISTAQVIRNLIEKEAEKVSRDEVSIEYDEEDYILLACILDKTQCKSKAIEAIKKYTIDENILEQATKLIDFIWHNEFANTMDEIYETRLENKKIKR